MVKLPALNGREVLRVLQKAGFYINHQSGSHARLFHKELAGLRVTIPIHSKDLPEKTLKSILKQADINEADFLKLFKK
jgi:predicted RNA binding protein YcfA (HicA-like mRNA interferase family)